MLIRAQWSLYTVKEQLWMPRPNTAGMPPFQTIAFPCTSISPQIRKYCRHMVYCMSSVDIADPRGQLHSLYYVLHCVPTPQCTLWCSRGSLLHSSIVHKREDIGAGHSRDTYIQLYKTFQSVDLYQLCNNWYIVQLMKIHRLKHLVSLNVSLLWSAPITILWSTIQTVSASGWRREYTQVSGWAALLPSTTQVYWLSPKQWVNRAGQIIWYNKINKSAMRLNGSSVQWSQTASH